MLFKKLLRTAWHYKAQFISMIIMVLLGVGMFAGFNIEWKSIEYELVSYTDETGMADYRIYGNSTEDEIVKFTKDDLNKVKAIDGVTDATRYLSVTGNLVDKDGKYLESTASINVLEDYAHPQSLYFVDSNKEYNPESKGIYLAEQYAKARDISVGDDIYFTISVGDAKLNIGGKVEALVKSPEFLICVEDGQLMPDYEKYGYAYITPALLEDSVISLYKENYKSAIEAGVTTESAVEEIAKNTVKDFYTTILVESDMEEKVFSAEVNKLFGTKSVILSKENTSSYSQTEGEVDEGKTYGPIIAALFLAIGVLTMITTMARITSNEKVQIGTLKALGFKDRRILWHYTSYGLFIGVLGAVVGLILGYGVAYFILNPSGMMGTYVDFPSWPLIMPAYTIPCVLGAVLLLTLISFLAVRKITKGAPAETLRPAAPKKSKNLLIEKTKLWKKFSFATKWNLRDIMRSKVRSFMTIFGVFGATILLVAGFGMQDTLDGYLDALADTMKYASSVTLNQEASEEEKSKLMTDLNAQWSSTTSSVFDDSTDIISLNVYSEEHSLISFMNKSCDLVSLTDDGAYISERVKDRGYDIGDTLSIHPYGDNSKTYTVKVAGVYTSYAGEAISVSENYAKTIEGFTYKADTVYSAMEKQDVLALKSNAVASVSSKQDFLDSFDGMMSVMNTSIAALVIMAVLLGVVVLYNLGVMSYVERYRQLATLKVVGFRDKHIGKILITQNIWLTFLGLIIGMPIGILVVGVIMKLLASEYEISLIIGWKTIVIPILVVFATSILVSLVVSRKNKKINMVEALKGIE